MIEFVVNVSPLETRIAILEDKRLVELVVEQDESKSLVGNIYKGRVDSVVPGMQAAFIDIGFEKNGFLYVSDIAAAAGTGDFEFVDGTAKRRKRGRPESRPRIETLLKKNQHIMVQVAKDTLGNKGCRLTNFITLAGRYGVLMPTVNHLGVSRKIEDPKERDRLKKILRAIRPDGIGLITRTAGEGRTRQEFEADLKFMTNSWEKVQRKMESAPSASLLHEDLNPVLRVMRDCLNDEVGRITVDDETEYHRVLNFIETFAPKITKRCKLYSGRRPVFDKLGIEEEIKKAMRRTVYLPSGGHICIDQTEALIAIDVNTGKFTGKRHLEDTVFKTNLEAAEEIARQARLRDLGGIIVIDFIDMRYENNRRDLLKKLDACLRKDRAKTTLSEVSELGMIEMTRKRVKRNLMKALSQPCPYCEGNGMVRSVTTVTFATLRELQSMFCKKRDKKVILQVHPDVARRLRNENKPLLDAVCKDFGREVQLESVSDFHIHDTRVLNASTRNRIEMG